MAFLSENELQKLGFHSIGNNVLISEKASLYNPEKIFLGSNIRVDDFCILSAGDGGIYLGDHVHLGCFVALIGKGKIEIQDFAGLSARTSVFSSSDDFSGEYLTGPTVPFEFTRVKHADVIIKRHAIVGAGSVILPGVTIGTGAAVGSMSVVRQNVQDFEIVAGNPAKHIKKRSSALLEKEKEFLKSRR